MIQDRKGYLIKDREISWLNFNERVLQEAENSQTPLMERLKFLAIFSSNLDEFFRVRVAQIRRIQRISPKKPISEFQSSPDEILSEIQQKVVSLQERFTQVYQNQIIPELNRKKIFLKEEKDLSEKQLDLTWEYFRANVLPQLFPVLIDDSKNPPHLRDRSIYLAVRMERRDGKLPPKHAIIEVPTGIVGRFHILPESGDEKHIILLENIIRAYLPAVFSIFDYDQYDAYIIKLTRDAEFTISQEESDYSVTLLDKIQKSLKQRSKGNPTRFVFDEQMPKEMLELLIRKLELKHVNLIPGGRYHNFKDFMDFPKVGKPEDYFESLPQIPVKRLDRAKTMFDEITKSDLLLHHPYQSFDYLIRLLREAAIDPQVTSIRITLYRVARNSNVVNALINAIKNGKKVIVLMELQARFDEESNIYWTTQLQEAGAQVYFGKPGQKVHCKLCLIHRKEGDKTRKYAHLSTGNYNGVTARLYSDFALFTRNQELCEELEMVTDMLFSNLKRSGYKHLLVAPDFMKKQFLNLIDFEMREALAGRSSGIVAKMNSLVDVDIIRKLVDASRAGVKIKLIVRGICCLVPDNPNISIISIIDRYLEHARVFQFHAAGKNLIYLSSADWMTRNLVNRIEIAFPIVDSKLKERIMDILQLQLNDNQKARIIDGVYDSHKVGSKDSLALRSQYETWAYLKNQENLWQE
ncbi:MAG: polyphosphate kinase 1 [Bacteroidetes bacterium]|nr:polyphosphate kinase 1 [Bacteroidota bacterium]MCK6612137.1 polyphosphate kinase 1 [Bacteroidia bacterium]